MPSRELADDDASPRGLGERDLALAGGRESLGRNRPDRVEFEVTLARSRESVQFAGETRFQPKGGSAPTLRTTHFYTAIISQKFKPLKVLKGEGYEGRRPSSPPGGSDVRDVKPPRSGYYPKKTARAALVRPRTTARAEKPPLWFCPKKDRKSPHSRP